MISNRFMVPFCTTGAGAGGGGCASVSACETAIFCGVPSKSISAAGCEGAGGGGAGSPVAAGAVRLPKRSTSMLAGWCCGGGASCCITASNLFRGEPPALPTLDRLAGELSRDADISFGDARMLMFLGGAGGGRFAANDDLLLVLLRLLASSKPTSGGWLPTAAAGSCTS